MRKGCGRCSEGYDVIVVCISQPTFTSLLPSTMSLLQDVLRSHTTDNLERNLDRDDSDDELVNVVRLIIPFVSPPQLTVHLGISTRHSCSLAAFIAAFIAASVAHT